MRSSQRISTLMRGCLSGFISFSAMNELKYLANMNNILERKQQAFDCILQMAQINPIFSSEERVLLSNIMKTSIDPIRSTIKFLFETLSSERSLGHIENADSLTQIKNQCVHEILHLCQQGIDLIETTLLPKAVDVESQIHLQKIRGDLYRYIIEAQPDSEKGFKNALEAYTFAYQHALSDLKPCSTVRLGAVLNFAVFKYEHQRCKEDAIEMLQNAKATYSEGISEETSETREEISKIVHVIDQNLKKWIVIESDDSEEEEEEEEEENHEEEEEEAPVQDSEEEEDY